MVDSVGRNGGPSTELQWLPLVVRKLQVQSTGYSSQCVYEDSLQVLELTGSVQTHADSTV